MQIVIKTTLKYIINVSAKEQTDKGALTSCQGANCQ